MRCHKCERLSAENEELRGRVAILTDALAGQVSKPHSNTDLIVGAALSGGDAMGLARRLSGRAPSSKEKKR